MIHGLRSAPPLVAYLAELDAFIGAEIAPLQAKDDNQRYFGHSREHARTDWDDRGLPREEWEALLGEAKRRADVAGRLRFAWPSEMGGKGGSNLAMAVIREHLANKPLRKGGTRYSWHRTTVGPLSEPVLAMLQNLGDWSVEFL